MTDKTPLLLVPGLLSDAAQWRPQIDGLKDIVESTVCDTTAQEDMESLARTLLREAPPRFALAGTSMGGYVAFEILRQAPERVTRLAILNSTARADTPTQQAKRRLLVGMARTGAFKGVTPRLLPQLIHPDHLKDAALTRCVTEMAARVGRDAFEHQQKAIMNRIDSRPFLLSIACPVLLIGGQQDRITPPPLIEEMADLIPHARIALLDPCGHLSTLEQPDEVTRLMRSWLEDT